MYRLFQYWILILACFGRFQVSSAAAKRTPEASSTLLRMHRLYQQQRPHDTTLYDTLQVHPNATAAQITKSYRKQSRKYHPDKQADGEEKLQAVREAYEVLKEDATRLPYHQYGLTQVTDAAFLLTGSRSPRAAVSPDQVRLLRLMGHVPGQKFGKEDRILFLAANLVERIRPLVEDAISPTQLLDYIAHECLALKKLPLGAQILRCIGRAYRHAGQSVLRELKFKKAGELSNVLRANLHKTKQVLEAAAAGSKFIVKEKRLANNKKAQDNNSINDSGVARIGYYQGDDDDMYADDDINQDEWYKANAAELESLQIEALWKVSKIQLDRTIQEACRRVLDGEYFFFPSHFASSQRDDWGRVVDPVDDGWVSSRGQTIKTSVGRIRAASALVQMGDAMVECAKDDGR